jgi:hypothetical protein
MAMLASNGDTGMALKIRGLAIRGYRGVGKQIQFLPNLGQMNLLIGPNNSGKSLALDFLARYLVQQKGNRGALGIWTREIHRDDVHRGMSENQVSFGLGVPVSEVESRLTDNIPRHATLILQLIGGAKHHGMYWLTPSIDKRSLVLMDVNGEALALPKLEPHAIQQAMRAIHPQASGGNYESWAAAIATSVSTVANVTLPSTVPFIPAIRQIGKTGTALTDFSGIGLIDKLAELQHPGHDERHKLETFQKINAFLRVVTDNPDAHIEIPHNREHVLVSIGDKVLPLSHLGTGIHEVIMIAAFASLSDDQIVCIEEPEIHLHTLLQRKLVSYLLEKTSNQYLIATHSSSLIETVQANVYRVWNEGGDTHFKAVDHPKEKFEICRDLGVRGSDLLQSNCIIWVEGPSDRIYIRAWLKEVDADLVEGVDYTVMFYGGRLLSHLDADESDVDDFIALRRMNRHSFVLIDSDKKAVGSRINATKTRIKESFGDDAWITAGREIENYINASTLESCIRTIAGDRFGSMPPADKFTVATVYTRKGASELVEVNKVKLAHAVVASGIDLDQLDLRQKIKSLASFVRKATA